MSTGQLTPGITTWSELERIEGNVLLIVNSPIAEAGRVAAVLTAVTGRTREGGVHVIAEPEWEPWLREQGVPDERRLLSKARISGKGVEVNHFLEASEAMLWVIPKQFRAVLGSTAHNQYNEVIQPVFEQRVSVLLGDGVLLAHCLPLPYIYVLDAAAVVHRFGREARVNNYQAHAERLMDDLFRRWQERGRPAAEDGGDYDTSLAVVERHLGRDVVTFDEKSPIVIAMRAVDRETETARVLQHLRDVLHSRDVLLAERSEAVEVRDGLLARIHNEALPARFRRLIGRGD